jgi:hypothetical protein
MIKPQIVLPENNNVTAKIETLHFGHCAARFVKTYRRGEETYFQFVDKLREENGRLLPVFIGPDYLPVRAVTEAFLEIETCAQAQQFFEAFGPWDRDEHGAPKTAKWSEILLLQEALKASWGKPYTDWDEILIDDAISEFGFTPEIDFERRVLKALTSTVRAALHADIIFTTLGNLPSAFCARHDCRRLFQKTSNHARKYCSSECAHVESVRKHRTKKLRDK